MLSPNVNQNSCRIVVRELVAVAAGTMSRALMSNAPTVEIEKFTMRASSTMKR